MNSRQLSGRCFCCAVEYEVADEFEYSAYCHCSNCRRTTGSAFKPFAGIRRNKFRLIRGDTDLLVYGEESGNDTSSWIVERMHRDPRSRVTSYVNP